MAVECFEIKWTGPYTLDSIRGRTEAKEKGVYTVYKGHEVFYIGKSAEFGKRLDNHRRNWTHILGEAKVKKLVVHTGEIYRYAGTHPSRDISDTHLRNIESFLINFRVPKPEGNPASDKRGYNGVMSPIIVNTGRVGALDKVIFHNQSFEKLLKSTLIPKRRKSSY